MLALLASIYLEALVVIYAAETNVVLAERLWPRGLLALTKSVDPDTLTAADRRCFESYAQTQRYQRCERISVSFAPALDDPTPPDDPSGSASSPPAQA